MIDDFMRELQERGLPTGPKVNLLPEAKKHFDAFTGDGTEEEDDKDDEDMSVREDETKEERQSTEKGISVGSKAEPAENRQSEESSQVSIVAL